MVRSFHYRRHALEIPGIGDRVPGGNESMTGQAMHASLQHFRDTVVWESYY